jgi:hypothetical protein
MTEAEWLACADSKPMLEYLRGKASDRKLRLLACACCRKTWELLTHEGSGQVVEVAERFADDQATQVALASTRASAEIGRAEAEAVADNAMRGANYRDYGWYSEENPRRFAAVAAVASASDSALQAATIAAENSILAASAAKEANNTRWYDYAEALWWGNPIPPEAQAEHDTVLAVINLAWSTLIRDIFGNPFRLLPPLPPAVLAWNEHTIIRLAEAIYEDRKLPEGTLDNSRLAILADAMLDAGSDDEALIQHCRSEGPHVRGCWAVDLILGKE